MGDEEVERIVGDWREARDRGERVQPEEVIAAHPDLADSLRARFEAMALLDAAIDAPRDGGARLRSVPTDRYAEFRVLGQGGMGIVYWALDTDLNRQVAFKVIRPDAGTSGAATTPDAPIGLAPPARGTPVSHAFETLKARFLQEAWVTAGLEHPGIVPVYEVGSTPEGVPYYTMRFVKGSRTLAAAIAEANARGVEHRLALLDPFLRVCDTIRYAHAHGVIHRDLKPDNVALGEFGEVVVLDWGLAKVKDEPDALGERWQDRIREYRAAADLRTLASALGTPGYMAPEAALGRTHEVDERSDVYSLGAMLFQILTGRLPFEFKTYVELLREMLNGTPPEAASIDAAIPAELSNLCVRALSRNRDARPPSVAALADEIRAWQRARERDAATNALLHEAEAVREGIEHETGEALLRRVDRLQAVCARLLAASPGHARGEALAAEAAALQERAIVEREKLAREQVRRRARNVSLVGAAIGAVGFIWLLASKKAEVGDALAKTEEQRALAEKERDEAKTERDAKSAALRDRDAALAAETAALKRAEGLRLVAESNAVRQSDPTLALLLAMQAHSRLGSLASRNAVLDTLQFVREERVLVGHAKMADFVAFSADGRRLVTSAFDGTARVWDAASGREIRALKTERTFLSVALSPDGTRVVTVGLDDAVRSWDVESGRQLVSFGAPDASIHLSADGRVAAVHASSDADATTSLWSVETGAKLGEFTGRERDVPYAFARDGSRLVTMTSRADGLLGLNLVDVASRTAIRELPRSGPRMVPLAAFSDDGSTLVVSWLRDDDRVVVADARTGATRTEFRTGMLGAQVCAVSPDGRRAVVAETSARHMGPADKGLTPAVFDLQRGVAVASLGDVPGGLVASTFSPDGSQVAFCGMSGELVLADAATGRRAVVGAGRDALASRLAFSPDGRLLACAGATGVVRLLRAQGAPVLVLSGHAQSVESGAFSPDGRRIVTLSRDGSARAWDVASGRTALELRGGDSEDPKDHDEAVDREESRIIYSGGRGAAASWFIRGSLATAAFSDDGTRVLTAGLFHDFRCHAFDAATGRDLGAGRRVGLHEAAFLGDGRRVAEVLSDGVRVCDLATGRTTDLVLPEGVKRGKAKRGRTRLFAAADRVVFAAGGALVVWDATSGKALRTTTEKGELLSVSRDAARALLRDDAGEARIVRLDADGEPVRFAHRAATDGRADKIGAIADDDVRRVATWTDDGVARVWDGASGREICALHGLPPESGVAAFSADGRRLATIDPDPVARVWDAEAGEGILTLRGHEGFVTSACFSPDGKSVLTTSADKTARLWPLDPIAVAAAVAPRELTDDERRRFDLGDAKR